MTSSRERARGFGDPELPGREDHSREVPGWLREAVPPVPVEFAPLLTLPGAPEGMASVATLADRALEALERAVAGTGERGGAWDLLTADALLTYACEAALDVSRPPPEEVLEELAVRVAGEGAPRKRQREEERDRD